MSGSCPICGEFAIEDDSDAHEACDIAEMRSWNLGFGVDYTGEEDVLGAELSELQASCFALLELGLSVVGAGLLVGFWVARKLSGRDRV